MQPRGRQRGSSKDRMSKRRKGKGRNRENANKLWKEGLKSADGLALITRRILRKEIFPWS